jgi:hypothetical protein
MEGSKMNVLGWIALVITTISVIVTIGGAITKDEAKDRFISALATVLAAPTLIFLWYTLLT